MFEFSEFSYLVSECLTLEGLYDMVKPKLYSIYNKYFNLVCSSYNIDSCKFEQEHLLDHVCACTRRFCRSDIEKLFHELYLKYTPEGGW